MSEHSARIEWQSRPGVAFTQHRYSRPHLLRFDGGAEWAGSSMRPKVEFATTDVRGEPQR